MSVNCLSRRLAERAAYISTELVMRYIVLKLWQLAGGAGGRRVVSQSLDQASISVHNVWSYETYLSCPCRVSRKHIDRFERLEEGVEQLCRKDRSRRRSNFALSMQ